MMGLLYAFATVLVLPAVAAARTRSSGGGGTTSSSSSSIDDSNFDAPPLEIANLVVYCLLLLATVIQLASAFPALLRSGARLPAAGAVIALTILLIGYALGIALIVTNYTVDFRGFQKFSGLQYINLEVAASLFFKWADPAIFAAVAILLRSRYRTVEKSLSGALIGFSIAASVLFVMMVVLIAAQSGLVSAVLAARFRRDISFSEASNRIHTSNNIFYAFIAFHIISTLFLAASAFIVNARTKKDRVMSLTLFAIIPLLVLHAIARLIFAILQALLPLSGSYTGVVAYGLDFASTLVYGLIYLAVMAVLVYIVVRKSLWDANPTAPGAPPGLGAPPPQFFVQGAPPAQFPGQWGYPQQPQSPYPQHPQYGYPQQYAYVPVYPGQSPGMQMQMQLPATEEKAQGSPQPSPATAQT